MFDAVCEFSIRFGEWVVYRTLVPYPRGTCYVLLGMVLAMWVASAYRLATISKGRR